MHVHAQIGHFPGKAVGNLKLELVCDEGDELEAREPRAVEEVALQDEPDDLAKTPVIDVLDVGEVPALPTPLLRGGLKGPVAGEPLPQLPVLGPATLVGQSHLSDGLCFLEAVVVQGSGL